MGLPVLEVDGEDVIFGLKAGIIMSVVVRVLIVRLITLVRIQRVPRRRVGTGVVM